MKILIFRSGAYGDNVIITPAIRYLHSKGHELYVQTSKRGMEVFKNNPHITRLIQHKEDTPIDKLSENIEFVQKKFKCDKILDFSESIEVALSQHPRSPNYKLSKPERLARFNRNFYEYSFEHIGESWDGIDLTPELFFDDRELRDAKKFLRPNAFNVLIGMSGSGNNKAWPYTPYLVERISNNYSDVHFITVGDLKCKIIEPIIDGRVTNLSGEISMRLAMALTGLVDLVIAPDTGIIHAAGCYPTPKICLLGHNTQECITKHFTNDYSIEADPQASPCAPCLFLIYDMKLQCPIHHDTGAALCMGAGISPDKVYERFEQIYAESKEGSQSD